MGDTKTPLDLKQEKAELDALQAWHDEKLKSLRQENASLQRSLRKRDDKFDLLRRAAEEAMTLPFDLTVPPMPKKDRRKREERTAVLHLTDWHLGKETESYSMAVAEQRLLQAVEKTIRFTEDQRSSYSIDHCVVYATGDLLEGEDIYPTQAHFLEATLLKQGMLVGPGIFVKVILRLLECFRTVKVVAVPGNHGRKSRFSDPESNYDTFLAGIAKRILLGSEEYPRTELRERLEFIVSPDWKYVDSIYDWGVLLVHGHQITGGSYGGYAWYGAGKAATNWALAMKKPFNYVFFGHRHSFAAHIHGHISWYAAGSTETDDDYALEKLKTMSFPSQTLHFFNREHGLAQTHTLFLTEPGERVPIQFRFSGASKEVA